MKLKKKNSTNHIYQKPFLIYLLNSHVEIRQQPIYEVIDRKLNIFFLFFLLLSYKNSVKSIQLLLSVSNALNTKLQYLSALPSG